MIKVQNIDNIIHEYLSNVVKLDILKNLITLDFKMLQNISMIVCIKKATKCVVIFASQNDLNRAHDVGVDQIICYYIVYGYLNLTCKLISHNIIKPLGKSYILCN